MDMGGPMQRMHSWLVRARRLGAVALSPKPRSGLQTILPAHLPQCPVPGVPPKSSRSKQNWAAKRAAWCFTEWLVALFGYYELKCPKSLPDISAALGYWYVSGAQHAYILELYEGIIPFCSVKSDEDFSRRRKSLPETLKRFRFANVLVKDNHKHFAVTAQYVDPSRISLPVAAAVVDPRDHIPPDKAAVLKNLDCLVLPQSEWEQTLPRPCHMVEQSKERALRHVLVHCGLASLIDEQNVPFERNGRKLLAGIFTVPHIAESDRLIIDSRPQNSTEHRLRWCTLPHGSLLTQIHLGPREHIRGSGDDLRNYFHLLRH